MNIALFSDSYFPTKSGVVTVVWQLRDKLEKMGHTVYLVCPETTEEFSTDGNPYFFRVRSRPLGLGTDQFITLPNNIRLLKFMKSKNIDIIHCHTEFGIGKSAVHIAKKLKIPSVCTLHTMWVDFYKYYLRHLGFISPRTVERVMNRFYRNFNALIGVSSKARNYYKKPEMIPNVPCVVIPNSIDTEKFQGVKCTKKERRDLRKKYGVKDDEVLFLFLGRTAEEKRVFELAELCKTLVEKNPKAKVMFVGNGPAYNELVERTKKYSIDGRIILTGFVEWSETHRYYESADVFITSSLSEMHSMTILEAELCGLPIVARMDESFLDCVFPGQNGCLADTDSDLLSAMLELSLDAEKRKAFGMKSLEITKNFTIESHIKKTLKVYEEVIKAYPKKIDEARLSKKLQVL